MRTWIRANGGPLAVVVLGIAITGLRTRFGWILIAIGLLWWVGHHFYRRSPWELRRKSAVPDAGRVAETLAALDHMEMIVIRTQTASEAAWAASPNAVAGQFSCSLGRGRYGPIAMAEAREAFKRLQRHGLVTTVGQDGTTLIFRWTPLGLAVRARILDDYAKEIGTAPEY